MSCKETVALQLSNRSVHYLDVPVYANKVVPVQTFSIGHQIIF